MPELVLHPSVESALANYLSRPSHALVLVGEAGSGKGNLLTYLAAQLLECAEASLENTAGFMNITGDTHIGIDEIRKIQHFLAMKPVDTSHSKRVIRIENAGLLTTEAQNALLKSVEEPPADSFLLLSAISTNELLPTIMSRMQALQVTKPDPTTLKNSFLKTGKVAADVDRAYVIANGLPGALASLLSGDADHPILAAADTARKILQADKFERLIVCDSLAKDRESALQVCAMLGRMSEISLRRKGLSASQVDRWRNILTASNEAEQKLRGNAQAKLTLTSMSLQM